MAGARPIASPTGPATGPAVGGNVNTGWRDGDGRRAAFGGCQGLRRQLVVWSRDRPWSGTQDRSVQIDVVLAAGGDDRDTEADLESHEPDGGPVAAILGQFVGLRLPQRQGVEVELLLPFAMRISLPGIIGPEAPGSRLPPTGGGAFKRTDDLVVGGFPLC